MTTENQQRETGQSDIEVEKVTGNIPSVIAPDEPFNPDPEIDPTTPQPEIPNEPQKPDITPPAPSPVNPTSPAELPPHIDPVPREI